MDPHLVELFFCSYMILIGLVLMNVVRSPSSARNMSSRRAHNLSSLASLALPLSPRVPPPPPCFPFQVLRCVFLACPGQEYESKGVVTAGNMNPRARNLLPLSISSLSRSRARSLPPSACLSPLSVLTRVQHLATVLVRALLAHSSRSQQVVAVLLGGFLGAISKSQAVWPRLDCLI